MKTVSSHVEDHMREFPFLSKFLRQGIINYKALARMIEPDISKKIGEKVSVGAIAVSLQRLHHRDKDKLHNVIGRLRGVKVVSNVQVFTASKRGIAHQVVAAIYADTTLDAPFTAVVSGDEETLVLAEKFAAEKVTASDLVREPGVYTALIITREVYEDEQKEVGGLSYPLQVLAENGVLVRAVTASFTEEVIVVSEQEGDRAASVLRHTMWR